MDEKPKHRWFHFRLSTMLWLFVVLGQFFLLLAAFRDMEKLEAKIAEQKKDVANAKLIEKAAEDVLMRVVEEQMSPTDAPREIEKLRQMRSWLPGK